MIGGWKATLVVPVSIEFVRMMGEAEAERFISERHSGDWLVRGVRGGRYIASPGQDTRWYLDKESFFHRGEWRFLGHRRTIRYVRPGSREALRFEG